MTDKHTQSIAGQSSRKENPADRVAGDEPMTGDQRSLLKTLSGQAKQPFDETLTKAQASRRIDDLQAMTGRGQHGQPPADAKPNPAGGEDQQAGRSTAAVETIVSR